MTQAALFGGLFIGVLSALPIINIANCCCLWILCGGGLAAYIAQQDDPAPLGPVAAARIGFYAGVVGAVVWLVMSMALDVVIAPLQQRTADMMLGNASEMPPDVRAWLETVATRASTPLRFAVGFVFQLFLGTLFSALGGLLCAAMFRRDMPSPDADGTR